MNYLPHFTAPHPHTLPSSSPSQFPPPPPWLQHRRFKSIPCVVTSALPPLRRLALIAILAGCSSTSEDGPLASHCGRAIARNPPDASSLSLLDAKWETDSGKPLHLSELSGRCHVLALFYTSCHVACPITVSKLQGIERSLPEALRSEVDFVLVTFAPREDTTDRLSAFRRENQLSKRFTLLRGSEAATAELARALGFGIQRGSAQRGHATLITLADCSGRILAQDGDLHGAGRPLSQAIRSFLREPAPSATSSR